MTFQEVLDLINAEIVANGNQEITADVLRPILVAMLGVPNDAVGDLGDLNTTDISNIVNAINSILSVNIPARTVIYPVSPALVDFDQPELEWVADAVNNTIALNGSFTVNNGEQMVFSVSALYGTELQTRYYRLTTGATVVNAVAPGELMPDGIRSTDVDSSLIIDLGDIGAADVWDAFNSDGDQPFAIIGDKFVQAVQGGESKLWQWIGGDGNFGNSATVALAGWFVLLTDSGVPVSGQTNLSYNPATGEVSNDNGDGFTIPEVTTVNPGLATPNMLAAANAVNGRIVQYGYWLAGGFMSGWIDYKVLFGNTVVDVVPDLVTYSPSATGYTRYDGVDVDSDGIVSLVTGVESTGTPEKPAPTTGKVRIGYIQISDSTEYWLPVSEGFVSKDSQNFQAVYGTGAVTLPITENFNYVLQPGITQVDGIESLLTSSPELNRFGQEMKIFNDTGGDVLLKHSGTGLYFQSGTDFTLPTKHVASFFYETSGGARVFTGSSVQGGELEKITEGGKTGWRLRGADPANYGDIGEHAVDLSFQDSAGNNGATGDYSHAEGYGTISSGVISHAEGDATTASGDYSHAEGSGTEASGTASHAEGRRTTASGDASHSGGTYNEAESFAETVIGCYSEDIAAESATAWDDEDYAFRVGTGADESNRADGFRVRKSGEVTAPSLTTDKIIDDKSLITKEYFEDNLPSGGATDLAYTPSPIDGTVTSSTGTDATIPLADSTNAGLLSPSEKADIASALQSGDNVSALTNDAGYVNQSGVRDTPLTGFSDATATPVTGSDLLLAAIGKLQGQANTALRISYKEKLAADNAITGSTTPTAMFLTSPTIATGTYIVILGFSFSGGPTGGTALSFSLGGTATIDNIKINSFGSKNTLASVINAGQALIESASPTPISLSAAITEGKFLLVGEIDVTVAGTVLPMVSWSTGSASCNIRKNSNVMLIKK